MNRHMRAFNLAVSGPTGSGKTTMACCLSEISEATLIPEPLPEALLTELTRAPRDVAFSLQRRITLARACCYRRARHSGMRVLDRTTSEDRQIFFRLHKWLGHLSGAEVERLNSLSERCERIIGSPTAVVILRASPEALVERMKRAHTPPILIQSLSQQMALYDDWVAQIASPWVMVDTTTRPLQRVQMVADWLIETLPAVASGKLPHNHNLSLEWKVNG